MLWRVAARIYTGASRRQLDGHGLLVQCLTLAYLLLLCLIPHIRFWVSYDVDLLCTYNLQTKTPKHILFLYWFLIISFWDHISGECCNCPTTTGIKKLWRPIKRRLWLCLWLAILRPWPTCLLWLHTDCSICSGSGTSLSHLHHHNRLQHNCSHQSRCLSWPPRPQPTYVVSGHNLDLDRHSLDHNFSCCDHDRSRGCQAATASCATAAAAVLGTTSIANHSMGFRCSRQNRYLRGHSCSSFCHHCCDFVHQSHNIDRYNQYVGSDSRSHW